MLEEFHSRQELAHYIESLPAEQAKQVVIDLLTSDREELSAIEKTFSLTSEPEKQELSTDEKIKALKEWAASHRSDIPPLSDEAISRESMYSNERL